MAFLTAIGSQQEVKVPKKQTNSNWGSQNDHLGSSSTVTLKKYGVKKKRMRK